jgi:hypothetical protein
MALFAVGLTGVPAGANGGVNFKCNGTVNGGTISSDVTVGNNATCVLNNVTVSGSVNVMKNAYFESNNSTISGSVTSFKALTLYIWNHSTVGGNVVAASTAQLFFYDSTGGRNVAAINDVAAGFGHFQVCGSTVKSGIKVGFVGPDVLIGSPSTGCAGNTVTNGDILAVGNSLSSELYVLGNTAQNGDIGVYFNTGSAPEQVSGNNAPNGDLFCSGNAAGFSGSGNGSVGDVSGPQCSAATITGIDSDDI